MASKTLKFYDFNPVNTNILIWPCNRKIRIFDFKNTTVDSIVKDGFTKKYFNNEISFRLNNLHPFVPVILAHGENWYREPLLTGQPLARILDDRQYRRSCNEAIANLKKIIDTSIKYVDPDEYAKSLFSRVTQLIIEAKKNKKISTGDAILKTAKTACNKANLLQNKIPVALSHGDLQSGNLWVDTNKEITYIIDWETNDLRSIWYDAATLLLSIRRHNGVFNMVTNCNTNEVKNAVLINDTTKEYDMDAVMGVLILEDIIFYLEDNLELQLDWGSEIIDRFGRQLMQLKWE